MRSKLCVDQRSEMIARNLSLGAAKKNRKS
jgi:hypothetical protein